MPNWTVNDLKTQFDQTRLNNWLDYFAASGAANNWKVEILLAIASRESNVSSILGDGGHGHGIMQIDDRYFPDFCNSDDWKDPGKNIEKGASILSGKRTFLSGKGVPASQLERASIAAYNHGEGNIWNSIQNGDDVDDGTTGGNYSQDVLARSTEFANFLAAMIPPFVGGTLSQIHSYKKKSEID